MGSRDEAQVGGLGTNPVGGMGNDRSPQKLATFLGLKVGLYFTQNTSIISYFNKVGLLIFSQFGLHTLDSVHFGWTPRLNYTVILTVPAVALTTASMQLAVVELPCGGCHAVNHVLRVRHSSAARPCLTVTCMLTACKGCRAKFDRSRSNCVRNRST